MRLRSLSIVPAIGAEIGSCYIDPLPDAEAEKRGFTPAETQDECFRSSTSHSKEEIEDFFNDTEISPPIRPLSQFTAVT
jgi:hypothetical protein